MRLNLIKRTSSDIPFGFIYGTIVVLALAAARVLPLNTLLPACAFKTFTGVPCPTCGTTRMFTCLAQVDLAGAFAMNPAVALAVIAALLLFIHDAAVYIIGSRAACTFSSREARWARSGAVAAFLANWIYLTVNL